MINFPGSGNHVVDYDEKIRVEPEICPRCEGKLRVPASWAKLKMEFEAALNNGISFCNAWETIYRPWTKDQCIDCPECGQGY